MLRRYRLASRLLPLLVAFGVLLGVWAPVTHASSTPAGGIALAVESNGTVDAGLQTVVANGSALRYAMDGYFGPLVALFPVSNATKATILSYINSLESNVLTAGLFGDHAGQVNGAEVYHFGQFIQAETKYVPVSTLTKVLNVTMDGQLPISDQLQDISFSNAPGPDNSSAPMGVTATVAVDFSWSGVGSSHTFKVAWNLPSILGNLTVPVEPVNVSFATPPAITITSVQGLSGTQISNDPFGWRAASASGQYLPLPGHTIVIQFGPAFPTGDVLIIGVSAAVVALAVAFVLLRRRRRRRLQAHPATPAAGNSETGVGPSSGSG